ncbi:hypothetical protein Golob_021825, partial [Gossypium lobatum]|nr:hypothetical protein [Gossypium lobatum]
YDVSSRYEILLSDYISFDYRAYSKALLFLASGSIIHSMEAFVGFLQRKARIWFL